MPGVSWVWWWRAALVLALGACSSVPSAGGPADPGPDATGSADVGVADAAEEAEVFAPRLCGSAPYEWRPAAEVGHVVSWEEGGFTDLSAADIDALLSETGYDRLTPVPYGARTFELRYVTQDRGELVEATAMVAVPVGMPVGELAPTALWLHGTSGFNDDCALSADPLAGGGSAALVASQGFVVVAPDYLGMRGFGEPSPEGTLHSYLAGEPTAIASLDALRASVAALADQGEVPLVDPSRVVAWGPSQGGHAALFVDRLVPWYAPEVELVAVVAHVPVIDQQAYLQRSMTTWDTRGPAPVISMTTMRAWYGVPSDLLGVLTDEAPHYWASSLPGLLASGCDVSPLAAATAPEDVFTPEVIEAVTLGDWEAFEPWTCFYRENSLPSSTIPRLRDVPVLVTLAEEDELILSADERAAVEELCGQGYRIELVECAGANHVGGAIGAIGYGTSWVHARMAAEPWAAEAVCAQGPPVDCAALP